MDRLGDLIIVDDDDERLVLGATGQFRAEVLPEDSAGEWRELTETDDIVEFYDPTDIFGDLADALAEAFPSIAPDPRTERPPRPKAVPTTRTPGRRGRRADDAADGGDEPRRPTATGAPSRRAAPRTDRSGREVAMRPIGAELVERREILPGQWLTAWHAPAIASGARAGQYVHVRTVEAGGLPVRRPFPIVTADAASGTLTIQVRARHQAAAGSTGSGRATPPT